MPRKRTKPPRSPELAALGEAIELVIAETPRMTIETVAEDSGLDVTLIGDYKRGQGNPTFDSLLKLCKGLHIDPTELMGRIVHLLKRRLES